MPNYDFYAVRAGTNPGVYSDFKQAKRQIENFKKADWKGFNDKAQARKYFRSRPSGGVSKPRAKPQPKKTQAQKQAEAIAKALEDEQRAVAKAFENKENEAMAEIENKQRLLEEAERKVKECASALRQAEDDSFRILDERESINMFHTDGTYIYNNLRQIQNSNPGTIRTCLTINGARETAMRLSGGREPELRLTEELSYIHNGQKINQLFVDGACSRNGKPGAKAAIGMYVGVNSPDNFSGPLSQDERHSNQRAELQAIKKAYDLVAKRDDGRVYEICTDSAYAMGIFTKWCHKWRKNGWRNSARRPVKHADLIQDILKIKDNERYKVMLKKVEAHGNCDGNNKADQLARDGI